MVFNSDFMKFYEELSALTVCEQELSEGKKDKNRSKKAPQIDYGAEIDSFLRNIGLVRISEIVPGCPDFSNSGAAIWAPSERAVSIKYRKDIPFFDKLAVNRLPKFVETLPEGEYPVSMWSPKTIQNNDGRKIFEVDLGSIGSAQWRGLCFRVKAGDKSYFIFGKIFYKGTKKINASTNSDVADANKFYDVVMKKLKEINSN
jgi:hypothetical protein